MTEKTKTKTSSTVKKALPEKLEVLKNKSLKLPVIIQPGQDGYFTAEIPIIPGCFSQGKTREEALVNIKEAALLCLECQKEEGWTIPEQYSVEQIEVRIV